MFYAIDGKSSKKPYILLRTIIYHSKRYDKTVIVMEGERSDGATWAVDIHSEGWWVHDELCNSGLFADGTLCSNLQASMIIHDILKSEGYWFRARTWLIGTFIGGGGECRKNGMFSIK